MYVLTAVRFATVMGCKDCTVVIGAAAAMVSSFVTLDTCDKCLRRNVLRFFSFVSRGGIF